MKRLLKVITLLLAILLTLILVFGHISRREDRPESAFRRHFGSPIPASVVIHEKWGISGLAGSSEFIRFSVSPDDLKTLVASHGLQPMALEGEMRILSDPQWSINQAVLDHEISTARDRGVNPTHAFFSVERRGLIYFLLLVDASGTHAIYHYYKS